MDNNQLESKLNSTAGLSLKELEEMFAIEVESVFESAAQIRPKLKPDAPFEDTGLVNYAPSENDNSYGIITEKRLDAILDDLEKAYDFWLAYPDKLIEEFLPKETAFKLFPFQIISLRANARHQRVHECAPRGFSKSFKAVMSKMIKCAMLPNSKESMLAANKIQAARIGREKIEEICRLLPFLKNEIDYSKGSGTTFGKDYIHVRFKNNSEFDIVSILESERGGRRHGLKLIAPTYRNIYSKSF